MFRARGFGIRIPISNYIFNAVSKCLKPVVKHPRTVWATVAKKKSGAASLFGAWGPGFKSHHFFSPLSRCAVQAPRQTQDLSYPE